MIPQSQLENLKPLADQENRKKQVDSKRTTSFRKGRLTKRARQWARYPEKVRITGFGMSWKDLGQGKGAPKGEKSYGNKPLKNNPRKEKKNE